MSSRTTSGRLTSMLCIRSLGEERRVTSEKYAGSSSLRAESMALLSSTTRMRPSGVVFLLIFMHLRFKSIKIFYNFQKIRHFL